MISQEILIRGLPVCCKCLEAVKQVVGLDEIPFRQCPKCGEAGVMRQENCDVCVSCAYSRCG